MTHIDDWLDAPSPDAGERFAREFLKHARRPAIEQDHAWLAAHPLYCTFRDGRFRCTGASRLGDVWLTRDFSRSIGYELRVDVAECIGWGNEP